MNMKYFNYKKLRNIGLCLLSLLSVQVSAQKDIPGNTNKISGIVVDAATGKPLVGVRIQAYSDPYYAAMTKEDGSYTINVSDYVSSLSFVLDGYNISVCPLSNGKNSLNTSLYSDKFSSEYSNSTIASKARVIQVESQNSDISIDPQMQQKMMGDIYSTSRSGQIGVGNTLLIDGINTLNINARPLIVLDGVLMDVGYDNETMHDGFFNNILSNIMVEDIEKVTVLKNGLAIYGAKGANGVILIDTKRNKSMATKIDLSISGNYQTLPKLPEVMNASQYRSYISELLGTTGTKLTNIKFLQTDPSYPYYNTYNNDTKWSDVVYDQAFIQNYSVNVQGGDEVANYNLSVGYAFGDATIVDNDYSRFNIRLNSDIVLSDNMDLRFDASYSDVNRDLRDDGATDNIDNSMITSPSFLSLIKSPFLSPYAYDVYGNISSYLASGDDYLDEVLEDGYSLSNPLALLENGEAINKNSFGNRLITIAISPKYRINRYLNINEHFNYTLNNADENYYIPINGSASFDIDGLGVVYNKVAAMNAKQDAFMSNTYLSYIRRFDAHSVDISAGFRYLNTRNYQTSMLGHNSGNDKAPNMTPSLRYPDCNGNDDKDISLTYWVQGNYNFKEKYYVSAGLGLSSSSKFGGDVSNGVKFCNVPWGLFPSIQGAWVASSESWFNVPFVDYLKINVGYDLTGNDGFDDSAAQTYFKPVKILDQNGTAIYNIGNNSLQWETTRKLTAGLDMSLLNNRLSLSFNAFNNKTTNMLSVSSLSYLTGILNSWSNGGSLKNDGFDITAVGKIMNKQDLKWEAGFSIGHYKTEIIGLPQSDGYVNELYGANIRTEVGSSTGYFLGYKTNGVYSTSAEAKADGKYLINSYGDKKYFGAGDVNFVDMDGNNEINEEDMVKIGDPNPDVYGRLFTSIYYKSFSLSATFAYSLGQDVYNYQRMLLESGSRFNNQTVALTNRWVCEGQVTDIPKVVYDDPMQNSRFSDRWIEDGSYLKLKNVTLSYKLPVSNSYIQGITVWGAANNILTITKYLGSDPEFSVSNNIYMQGIDTGLLPQSANFSFGVKINL